VLEGLYGEKTRKAMKKYKFKAKIEAGDGGGAYVLFPYDTGKKIGSRVGWWFAGSARYPSNPSGIT
jgi:hypothetical protein